MSELQNLYEVRKTVRFELKTFIKTSELLKPQILDSKIKHIKEGEFEAGFDWNKFCNNQYEDFLNKSEKFTIFLGKINVEISKRRGDKDKKDVFFDFKRSKGIFKNIPSLKKIEKFDENFKEKLLEIESEYKIIFGYFRSLIETETRNEKKSDISKNLRKIAYLNRNFLTIFKFLDKYKTDVEIFDSYMKLIDEEFEKINNSIIASHENETTGACIGKYTFNKYSLFRRETDKLKNDFDDNKIKNTKTVKAIVKDEEKKLEKDKEIRDNNGKVVVLKFESITNIKLEKDNKDIQEKLNNFNFERNLDEVISELDFINGQLLNNYIQDFIKDYAKNKQSLSFEYLIENGVKKYNKGEVTLNGKKYNISALRGQKLDGGKYLSLLKKEYDFLNKEEKELIKLVYKFLNIVFKNSQINKNYVTIKSFRDLLAKYRGKIRQDLCASEREFINEAMIESYAKILEKDGMFFLALTKKDKILDKKIENIEIEKHIKSTVFGSTFKIYNYSHLHFGALEKLCFMGDGDLVTNVFLSKQWNRYKNQKDSSVKIDFDVFKKHIIQSLNQLKANNGEDWTKYIGDIGKQKSIEDIVNLINQKFYKLEKKEILTEKLFELAENGDIELYQIYSKDFNIFDERFLSGEREKQRIIQLGDGYNKEKIEVDDNSKLISKTTREKGKKENLFTSYFKEIFKNTDTYLGQEGGVFFRNGDKEKVERRFLDDKFFVSFEVKFYKGQQNHNSKLCERKDMILEEHIKNTTLKYFDKIKNKDEIVIMGIDRGSLSENISDKDNKISMIGYLIIKLRKEKGSYILSDILSSGDINGLKRGKGDNWEIVSKGENIEKDIDFKNILKELKENIENEMVKSGKRDIIKIIEKKKGLTGLLINKLIELFLKYNVDYISIENQDNIFKDDKSYKKIMEENTISAYLYQNLEVQLFNKLQYITSKNEIVKEKQFFPIYKIDELKNYNCDKWFNNKITQNKIIGNIIFVKTAGTSTTCFNCNYFPIGKHKIKCDNCGIIPISNGKKLDLNNYKEYFVNKTILEKQNTQTYFNNDARAGLFIAKKGLEYINSLK